MEKEIFINTQFAIFFDQEIRPELFISKFIEEMGNVFDQTPLTFPVPNIKEFDNAPSVQFTSSNGLHSCGIAKKRIDYYHFSSDRLTQFSYLQIKDNFISNVEKISKILGLENVNRIGFLTKFFWENNEQGKIISKLIKDSFKKLHGGEIHDSKLLYISRLRFDGLEFEFNNSTTIEKTTTILYENLNSRNVNGILISRDFNTIPEKTSEYKGKIKIETIKDTIQKAEENFKIDSIIKEMS